MFVVNVFFDGIKNVIYWIIIGGNVGVMYVGSGCIGIVLVVIIVGVGMVSVNRIGAIGDEIF